jgi:hypothetical protein
VREASAAAREASEAGEGSKRGGATKPPTPWLAVVEAVEQALELRVWGWKLAGAGDGGGRRGRLEGGPGRRWTGGVRAVAGGGRNIVGKKVGEEVCGVTDKSSLRDIQDPPNGIQRGPSPNFSFRQIITENAWFSSDLVRSVSRCVDRGEVILLEQGC